MILIHIVIELFRNYLLIFICFACVKAHTEVSKEIHEAEPELKFLFWDKL